MPDGVEEVLRLIISVADGERRVGGRVGFDGGEGDAMTTTTTMATMMTARAMATPTMMTMWMVTWFVVTSWSYRW
jgi:hypothetical protein